MSKSFKILIAVLCFVVFIIDENKEFGGIILNFELLEKYDSELAECLKNEEKRQKENLEMIASESVQPKLATELAGSIWNNKTSVGIGGKQRLKGSQYASQLEKLVESRACQIFGADHAIVTPYSGSMANYCSYVSVLNPGDHVLALEPSAGAHQTHGGADNVSSKIYNFKYFGLVPETMLIDYEAAERIATEFKPKIVIVGSAAYSRRIDYKRLAEISHKSGALFMTDIAHFTGLIAAGASPNPVPYADIVTASTTKTMCGPHSAFIMCKKEYADMLDNGVYPGMVASVHLQTIAAMGYALQRAKTEEFRLLMHKIVENSRAFCDSMIKRGFKILTGGTDCHMFVVDFRDFDIDCEKLADVMQDVGITVNTKGIPYDLSKAPRGMRAGVTVLTQRGMGVKEMDEIAGIWSDIINNMSDELYLSKIKEQIKALCEKFPLPQI